IDVEYTVDLPHSTLSLLIGSASDTAAEHQAPIAELPINKPPYGTLTAIDLNTGERRWQITLGDSPQIRRHPLLHGVRLPPLLGDCARWRRNPCNKLQSRAEYFGWRE